MAKDFYEALGVGENAAPDDIKRAFRSLAKKYHPDRNPGDASAEKRFKEISEAYDTLSDPKKKQEYDALRKYGAFAGGGGRPGAGFDGNVNFGDFFHRGGGPGGGYQTFRSSGMEGISGFDEILSNLFGGGDPFARGKGQRAYHRRGPDIKANLKVSFREAIDGAEKVITLKDTGKKLRVKIPAGIDDGGKIRLVGQGRPGFRGGQFGDLIITVRVMPDQTFERKGNDVYTTVTVSFREAILGGKVNVKTLTRTIALTIPAGTQPGTKMRLRGMGLTVGDVQGDQYVTINVEIPTTITDKQRELLEKWESA